MKLLSGVPASPGVATAVAYVYRPNKYLLPSALLGDVGVAVDEMAAALERVGQGLDAAASHTSGAAAEILRAQALLARDPALRSAAEAAVRAGQHPASAVLQAGEHFAAQLEETRNAYLAARAPDVRHICDQAARDLAGAPARQAPRPPGACVLVAEELAPGDTATLDAATVLAIVTEIGTASCHTALIARSLQIPAVLGVRGLLDVTADGSRLGVDGSSGTVYLDPDRKAVAKLAARAEALRQQRMLLREAAGSGPVRTADGYAVDVVANIRGAEDLQAALDNGAQGVGLLRTELLYLDRDVPPSEDEQAALLRRLHQMLGPRRLVVRTFDIGADKPVPFLPVRPEHNPELGVRGIRLAQLHPELLDAQLRAVASTSDLGPTGVMAPMVATVDEARWFIDRVRAAGMPSAVEIGVMVEVPALLFAVHQLPPEISFLSVGTNDLTQYLHAADRRQPQLTALLDPFLPAVLHSLDLLVRSAGTRRIAVCGEAASDPGWAMLAIGIGVSELSMQPAALPAVRAALRKVSIEGCRDAVKRALEAETAAAARAIADELSKEG
jgi:phosphotransferase system enzyme I (PtsI)